MDAIEKYINIINTSDKIKEQDRIGPISMDKYIDNTTASPYEFSTAFINVKFTDDNTPFFVYKGKEYIRNDSGDKESDSGDNDSDSGSESDNTSLSGYSIESESENDDNNVDDNSIGNDSLNLSSDDEIEITKKVNDNGKEKILCINCKKNITNKDKIFKSYIAKDKNTKQLIYFCKIKCFENFDDWPSFKK